MSESEDDKKESRLPDGRDLVGFVGVCLIGYGGWLVYEPAGFIAAGVIMAGVAIFGVRG